MARKVFISFLGTGWYEPCHYQRSEYKSQKISFIQEATLEYIGAKQWTSDDAVFIMLTQKARERNWEDDGQIDPKTKEKRKQEGLCTRLTKMGLPMRVNDVSTSQESDEKTIMRVFMQMFDLLNEGDELYLDITHAFRYLPMLMVVLANYAKFVKNVTIKSITYGNWEGRDEATNTAQIEDLTMYSTLLDWTAATADFLHSGNATEIGRLGNESLKPFLRPELKEMRGKDKTLTALNSFPNKLKAVVDDFRTCRGINITNGKTILQLRDNLHSAVDCTYESPVEPIIRMIENDFDKYGIDDILNGLRAARWCLDRGMYQQAVTMMQETIVTIICKRNGIAIDNENLRMQVNKAFNFRIENKLKDQWDNATDIDLVERLLMDAFVTNDELCTIFRDLTNTRNDINHFGMRVNQQLSNTIETNLTRLLEQIELFVKSADSLF